MQPIRFTGPNVRLRLGLGVLALLAIVTASALEVRHLLNDPKIILLLPKDGAEWIQRGQPANLFIWISKSQSTAFRTSFQVPEKFTGANVEVRALGNISAYVDKLLVFDARSVVNWKVPNRLLLPGSLSPGSHRLEVIARNSNGPALVCVYGPALNLRSDASWQASADGKQWGSAVLADAPKDPALEEIFGPCASDFVAMFPLIAILFAGGLWGSLHLYQARHRRDWVRWLRWGSLIAWGFIAVNNYFKMPQRVGYDIDGHMAYIRFIVEHGRLPLPNEGWEFFQAPFFYLIAAPFYRLMLIVGSPSDVAMSLVRFVTLLSAMGIVEICYRAARLAFPNRRDLQAVVVIIGGFLPMNLYMAPSISNEPLAGLLGCFITLCAFHFLLVPRKAIVLKWQVVFGGLLGLALLTKITALLWIPSILFFLMVCFHREKVGASRWLRAFGVIVVSSFMVCSWYFIRNWVELGSPFLTGSQIGEDIPLQDPGFRTPHQFLEFGHVLARPIFSGLNSIWDSLYGTFWADGFASGNALLGYLPPWNYRLMSCGIWLGVFPMLAILVGAARCVGLTARQFLTGMTEAPAYLAINQFAVLAIGCFVGAIALEYLKIPMYSYGKATYMLGLIPCFAVLAASGFEMLPKRPVIRSVAAGLLVCWAVIAFMTYWIV